MRFWIVFVLFRFVFEKFLKDCLFLSNEITFPYGTGFKKYKPQRISTRRKKVSEFILDETVIKAGLEYIWLWVAIEPKNREILALDISKERNMFVAERFLSDIVKEQGKYPVSTDGAVHGIHNKPASFWN